MRHNPLSILLSVLAAGSLCTLAMTLPPHWGSMRVKHAWSTIPENWVCLGHPPADTAINIQIALKPQHENALIDALYEVSSPVHPKYGEHLSKEQVAKLVAPHADTLELVGSWLEHNGVSSSAVSMTHGGSWLKVTGILVSQANNLLGASYQLYRHTSPNTTVLRTISYSLPAELHTHVQTIVPTTYFGSLHVPWQTPRIRSDSGAEELAEEASGEAVTMLARQINPMPVTPSFLRSLYKTTAYVPAAVGRNKIGIGGFLQQYPNPEDLSKFMDEYRTDGADATYKVTSVNGGYYDPNDPNPDANSNVQYASAMTYPTPLTFYSTGGTWINDDPFLAFLNYLLVQPIIPQTISISFGAYEVSLPMELAGRICYSFASLGALGVSVLVSTGDDGVGLGESKDTAGNVNFLAQFPATCPFVTSVGGTKENPEVAAPLSGGGFSRYFVREPYQNDAVDGFFHKLGSQYEGMYNPFGRAIPDISAQALNYEVMFDLEPTLFHGTSCATPTVAGIISLLNDYRISKGKKPLGWLNPWLYGSGRAGFYDITSGSNPGCNTDGFFAVAGWDPVTGLGTPRFDQLKRIMDQQMNAPQPTQETKTTTSAIVKATSGTRSSTANSVDSTDY
ncbi:peptidase S8/S53 domain-containing protein [Lactarius quietus]|nr:peptidase S8/S53 domain-containing protein [Lactarius quietus]